MTLRFAVVHEAEADFQTATELADRELVDAVNWLDDAHLQSQRDWVAATGGGRRLTWAGIKHLASEEGIKAHGHFNGEPGAADAAAARRAILFLLKIMPELGAIVLVRDRDDQPERRVGLEQARDQDHSGKPIVIGLAVVERECWPVCGFEPADNNQLARLGVLTNDLGFDPRMRSHDLTAHKDDNALRSPKRILRELTGNDRERERRCWVQTPLQVLRDRGQVNGLREYLEEVRQRLAPLIGHVSQ